jgi:multidrug efflux pump subunit AcrA (membrane-fusion protein)
MSGANLRRVEALEQLKSALASFVEDAKMALGSVEMETRRLVDQLQREVPFHWNQQILIGRDEFAQAKAALARKRLQKSDGYIPDTSAEEEMLDRAKRRVATAEAKLEAVKKWQRRIEEAWNEYQGPSGQLAEHISGNPPRPIADLNKLIKSIEAYLNLQAPSAPEPISEGSSLNETPSMARPRDTSSASIEENILKHADDHVSEE